jgi:hypothetical protein
MLDNRPVRNPYVRPAEAEERQTVGGDLILDYAYYPSLQYGNQAPQICSDDSSMLECHVSWPVHLSKRCGSKTIYLHHFEFIFRSGLTHCRCLHFTGSGSSAC